MMRNLKRSLVILAILVPVFLIRCANIVPPNGGPKDTIPPVLVSAIPPDSSLNFHSKTIILNFDEYLQLESLNTELIYNPTSIRPPVVISKFRTLTIQLKDTLKPNTTYSMDFGNAVRDLNEGNILKNFKYIFSTGKYLDSLKVSGHVTYAETGQPDSNVVVMLFRNKEDSVVSKERPVYYTRSDGRGDFRMGNLPHGEFKLFALKDEKGSLTYSDSSDFIAYADKPINLAQDIKGIQLYLFAVAKKAASKPAGQTEEGTVRTPPKVVRKRAVRRLRISPEIYGGSQDITSPLGLAVDHQAASFDSTKLHLFEDTTFTPVQISASIDSTGTQILINRKWDEEMSYRLVIDSELIKDSAGIYNKSDTIDFHTRSESDYGSIILHFSNLDSTMHYVVEIISGETIRYSGKVTGNNWRKDLVTPGEYEVRVLLDTNDNGKWDNGRYYNGKRQPEHVIAVPGKLNVRANWENRTDISL